MSRRDKAGDLLLGGGERRRLWRRLAEAVEAYLATVPSLRVTPELAPGKIRALLQPFDFERPLSALEAVDFAVESLSRYQTHTPHPRYFGLFNPGPTAMGIAADALAAAFNPQLAAWSHSPLAIELEGHLVRAFAEKFGYPPSRTEGTFTSGGAEANHTAILVALTQAFPEFLHLGLRALPAQPVLYLSVEGHGSLLKAARLCGLGAKSVREIPVDGRLRMSPPALASEIARDRREGSVPFLVVATAGTTGAGAVDPLPELRDLAQEEGLWLHVDAAWGGAAALLPELRPLLEGLEGADSITFDAHKWLSVPMGAGLYLSRHQGNLERTFRVAAGYMPREAAGLEVADPYAHSMQWSRRFIGLKVFLSLAVAGWEGYRQAIRHQVEMGERLGRELAAAGWKVVNDTPLPVVCFVDGEHPEGRSPAYLEAVAARLVAAGEAWISTAQLGPRGPALRACITNYRTGPEDISALVGALGRARQALAAAG